MSDENKPTIDSDDFTELLIKHLARDPKVFALAQQYRLSADDFVINDMFGIQIYKQLVDCILRLNSTPLTTDMLANAVNRKFEDNALLASQYDDTANLIDYIFHTGLSSKHIVDNLKDFLKARRVAKITFEHKDNPDEFIANLNALAIDLTVDDIMTKAVDIHPFAEPQFKQHQDLLGTGLRAVDEHINGLGMGEFGLIIGYSGGGKTVFGTNIVSNNAIKGTPAQFISCEENEVQISQRFYSKFFDIAYTELHKGMANIELEAKFKDPMFEQDRLTLARNLSLIGLKGLTPITTDQIYEVMVRKYEKTGFVPSVVVLDQLQFIEPMRIRKNMASWDLEKQTAVELDELSHKQIGNRNFALWVMHQAKGKLRRHFSREEIDGFKGIIHKSDLVMGIGRDGINANEVDMFSLKVRHCADFIVTLGADFRFMRFVDRPREALAMAGYSTPTSNPMERLEGLPPLPEGLPQA